MDLVSAVGFQPPNTLHSYLITPHYPQATQEGDEGLYLIAAGQTQSKKKKPHRDGTQRGNHGRPLRPPPPAHL